MQAVPPPAGAPAAALQPGPEQAQALRGAGRPRPQAQQAGLRGLLCRPGVWLPQAHAWLQRLQAVRRAQLIRWQMVQIRPQGVPQGQLGARWLRVHVWLWQSEAQAPG